MVRHRYLQGSASSWSIYFQFLQNIAITTPYFWPQKVRLIVQCFCVAVRGLCRHAFTCL